MSLGNIIKSAIKTMLIADTKTNVIPQMQVKLYDSIKNCGKLGMYGLYGNAPQNSFVILMQINGQEEVLFGIEDDVNNRPRALKEGEVMIMNTITRSYIYLTSDGSIDMFSKTDINTNSLGEVSIKTPISVKIDAPQTNITGNLSVGTGASCIVPCGNMILEFTDGILTNVS